MTLKYFKQTTLHKTAENDTYLLDWHATLAGAQQG